MFSFLKLVWDGLKGETEASSGSIQAYFGTSYRRMQLADQRFSTSASLRATVFIGKVCFVYVIQTTETQLSQVCNFAFQKAVRPRFFFY